MKTAWKVFTAHPTVRKASAALGVTFIGGIGTSLADGDLTFVEIGISLGAALVASAAVWKAENETAE